MLGYANTVAGNLRSNLTFTPGIGIEASLLPLRLIIPHPFYEKFYFFTDSYGVRVLCIHFIISVLLLFIYF